MMPKQEIVTLTKCLERANDRGVRAIDAGLQLAKELDEVQSSVGRMLDCARPCLSPVPAPGYEHLGPKLPCGECAYCLAGQEICNAYMGDRPQELAEVRAKIRKLGELAVITRERDHLLRASKHLRNHRDGLLELVNRQKAGG